MIAFSPSVLSSFGLPLLPTCLILTVSEARRYFASTIQSLQQTVSSLLTSGMFRITTGNTATAELTASNTSTARAIVFGLWNVLNATSERVNRSYLEGTGVKGWKGPEGGKLNCLVPLYSLIPWSAYRALPPRSRAKNGWGHYTTYSANVITLKREQLAEINKKSDLIQTFPGNRIVAYASYACVNHINTVLTLATVPVHYILNHYNLSSWSNGHTPAS
jgi:hypothetical protein